MANLLQQIAYDTSRTAAEGGEIREPVLNNGNGTYSKVELIVKDPDNSTKWHWPSVERLLTGSGVGSPTDSETITAGCELIGVDDNSFSKITGDTTLRVTLKSIDTALNAIATLSDVILKSGTVDMEGAWETQANLTVKNPNDLDYDQVAYGFSVMQDGAFFANESTLGSEKLNNPTFTGSSNWTFNNPFSHDGVNNRVDITEGITVSGNLTQSTLVSNFEAGKWYVFEYEVVSNTADSGNNLRLVDPCDGSIDLDQTVGTHKLLFKATESLTQFALLANGWDTGSGVEELDNFSAKEVTSAAQVDVAGELEVRDNITLTNGNLLIKEGNELRFYDTGSSNYTGFEAPALTADCMYVLPTADGSADEVLTTNGSKTLSWGSAYQFHGFSAYLNTAQTNIANTTPTKVQLDGETFDPDSDYDNATNYRYTPSKAGKYMFIGTLTLSDLDSTKEMYCAIYKNGTRAIWGTYAKSDATADNATSIAAGILSANGSTDYFELYVWHNNGDATPDITAGDDSTKLEAFRIDNS